MPSVTRNKMPKAKQSKSPAKTKSRGRSKSASRSRTSSRSRSRSAGRRPKPVVPDLVEVKVKERKTPAKSKSKSPSRSATKGTSLIKQTITSAVISSTYKSSQEEASVTPGRSSLRISSLREEQKMETPRRRELVNSETISKVNSEITKTPAVQQSGKSKRPHYEFMGPVGTFLLIFLLPVTLYYVNLTCSQRKCSVLDISNLTKLVVASLFELEAALIFLAWFFFQAILALLPIGRVVEGQPLRSGGRLHYRCNGLYAFVVSLVLLGAAVYFKCPVTKVIDKFFPLMTTAFIFSFLLSIYLYVRSRYAREKDLAPGGNTGNIIYDFFIGRELNPRIGPLDLKFFCELRPGLIGWVLLDWIMVVKAYQETGSLPTNLVLVTLFQTLYVADSLWFEEAILTTMDIIHDGFGFMLAFGDLAWVPFLYSLQPRFIYENKFVLPWYCLAPIVVINLFGYGIFRLANLQKNLFRSDPNHPAVRGLETIPTHTSKKLLVSGWWGLCHKPNYMGDLIMAVAWSLTTGFGQVLTYFYPIYFLILLVHRERRDNEQCQKKYGASWDKYCQRVKYRIFPYIY